MNTRGPIPVAGYTPRSRRACLAGGAGAAAALLAACGGAVPGSTTGAAQIKDPVTIEFAHRWEGVREPLIQQQIDSFRPLQPNIKINAQQLYCSGGENCLGGIDLGKITAQIAAGTPPDLFMVQSPHAADYAARSTLKNL